jgi:hypothetical protein
MYLLSADKWRAHKTGAFSRAEIAMPLSGILALWISALSLIIHNLVFETDASVDAVINKKMDRQVAN